MRALVLVLALAAPLGLCSVAAACDEDSWRGGTTEWCDGALVYRDYVYDDAGADQGSTSPHGAPLNPTAGDVDHRQHGQQLNSADLLSLRLRADGGALAVRAELNTLFASDRTVVAVAVDTDANPATGGGLWKDLDVRSTGWEVLETFTQGDPATNVIRGSIPLPAGSRWRVQAAVARADTKRVMNLHLERAVLSTIDFALGAEHRSFDSPELRANVDRFLEKQSKAD